MAFIIVLLLSTVLLMKFFQENTHILSAAMIADLHCPSWWVDSSVALQPFGYMVSSIFAGIFGDLIGMRTILLGGLGTTCISSFCIAYSNEILVMKIARFTLGIGLGTINCCAFALMKHIGKDKNLKATISSSYIVLFSAAAVYPLITKLALSSQYSWRCIMLVGSIIAMILLSTLLFTLPSIHTQPESMGAYRSHAYTLLTNPSFVRCCTIACMTMGHTYALQALLTAYKRDLIASVNFDQPVLQSVARLFMVVGAVYANRANAKLERLSYKGGACIVAGCATTAIAIIANDFFGGNETIARLMMYMLCCGFAASYMFIGIAQTAAKTEVLLLAGSFPGIAQGLVSTIASGWETVGTRIIYGLRWPLGAIFYFALLLSGMLLVHRLLCASTAQTKS